jgi:transmembrane sensor
MEDLLIKYVLGEATGEEAAQVGQWLEADAANRRLYEEYKTLWALSRQTAAKESARLGSAETRMAWRRLKSKPAEEGSHRARGFGWLRLAAAAILILVLGGGYLLFRTHRQVVTPGQPLVGTPGRPPNRTLQQSGAGTPEVPRMMKLAAARPRTDTLPDGTVVTLNRGAALTIVGGSVEKGLTVRLRGEGFFSVRHDPARTFVVQIGAVAVKVLGTSFELNGDGDDSIELIVETGAVRVGDRMTVHSGERMTMTARGHWKIGSNRDKLYGYYLGRPLVCDSLPLRQLVEVLNRANETPIVLGRKGLGDLPLTTVFRGQSPERILEVVALTFNLSIVRQGSAIILQ